MRSLVLAAVAAATFAPAADAGGSVAPNPSRLGDVVTVTLPSSARPAFGAFAIRSQTAVGGGRTTYRIQCVDAACAPGATARRIVVPGLPAIVVLPRVTRTEVARPAASFRRETARPSPRYAVDPTLLRSLLAVAAAAAAAAAALLRRRPRIDARTPREKAIALVRASAARDAADRRRALDLLAKTVHEPSILDDAWDAQAPTPERVLALADALEEQP